MNQVVVFAESISTDLIAAAFPQLRPLVVSSKSECANALVGGSAIDCLVAQRDAYGPEFQSFLSSVKRHFPVLEIILIAPAGPTPAPEGCHFIEDSLRGKKLVDAITALAGVTRPRDQRQGIRHDWPLGGQLLFGGQATPCKVRSFSSTGAFLEMGDAFQADAVQAAAGQELILRVEFLNSHISVKCSIVRLQEPGPEGPAGYGVRFLEFSSQAHELCERIVRDAVMQALLNPDEEEQVPALMEGDLVIPGFNQL